MKKTNQRRILFSAAMLAVAGSAVAQDGVSTAMFQLGAVDVRPNAAYTATYDDNIFASHKSGNKTEDVIHNIGLGVNIGTGDYRSQASSFFAASYGASLLFFQDNDSANATDHSASISLGSTGRLGWRFDQTLVAQSDPDVLALGAAGRVKRKTWASSLGTVYDLGDKSQLEGGLGFIFNDYGSIGAVDSKRLQGNLLMDYSMSPKLNYGFGGVFGYDQVEGSQNAVFEQANVRAVWEVSPKVAMVATVGMELRQYQGTSKDVANFVFTGAADWKASPLTGVSLGVSRGIAPSNFLINTSTMNTGVDVTVAHKMGSRYTATLATGYTFLDGKTSSAVAATATDADVWYIRTGLSARLADRLSSSVFHMYRRNDSNTAANAQDYTNHQVGVNVSYAF